MKLKKDEKEDTCSGRKRIVLCSDDVDLSLRIGRCCGSCAKHLDHCKIAGGFGCKQRRVPRNRRDIGGYAVC